MCSSPAQFVWLPQTSTNPTGPDTTDTGIIVETGTADAIVSCSVVPSGSGGSPYTVDLVAQITGGSNPATLTITGVFPQRGRDAMGNPNADMTQIPNITADYLDATKHLRQTNCFAQYVLADDGQPGASLPSVSDTFADSNGGRIWATVFCESPTNLLESSKPGNSGCETSATFRFENCSSKSSN
jgi:hypothetical protein